jgi:hypothetical protein
MRAILPRSREPLYGGGATLLVPLAHMPAHRFDAAHMCVCMPMRRTRRALLCLCSALLGRRGSNRRRGGGRHSCLRWQRYNTTYKIQHATKKIQDCNIYRCSMQHLIGAVCHSCAILVLYEALHFCVHTLRCSTGQSTLAPVSLPSLFWHLSRAQYCGYECMRTWTMGAGD